MFQEHGRETAVLLSVLLSTAVPAAAQDKGRVGLTMGYPAGVGLMFHVSDRFALRPEVSFTREVTEGPGSAGTYSTTTTWSVGVGLSVLFYLHETDNLRTYVSPRFSYGRVNSTWTTILPPGAKGYGGPGPSTEDSYQVSGSFGAQYALGRRFSVFGDLGIAYTDLRSWNTRTWGPRAGFGAILYF
jgi:hypothetical protein